MAEKEVKLMKGNEVIAYAAIRYGCDGYFGYPITPQSEVMETLMELKPWETTGMVVLQAESEVSSINMVYGGAATGKRVMTSSSSPGISLMSEGLSYLAGAELPCLVINCQRGGPGLGTIQPSQGDYFQAVKGGGHGDYHLIVFAPNSVQEMHDHVAEAFDLLSALLQLLQVLFSLLVRLIQRHRHRRKRRLRCLQLLLQLLQMSLQLLLRFFRGFDLAAKVGGHDGLIVDSAGRRRLRDLPNPVR